MMKFPKRGISVIFTLLLFCIYTGSALVLVTIGSNVYSQNTNDSKSSYDIRTSALYITEKVRQNETINSVSVEQVNGNDALVLSITVNENIYQTWVYEENGYLCEILIPQGQEILENTAQKIMPIENVSFTINEKGILTFEFVAIDGETYNSHIFLDTVKGDTI